MAKEKIGPLVIIGGHEDREGDMPILEEFVHLAGGDKAHIVVMPVASEEPEEISRMYLGIFNEIGVARVDTAVVVDRPGAYHEPFGEMLRQATGVFFTGGSQLRISSMLGGSPMDRVLHERQQNEGLVVAGTSAGASIMADTMILAGEAESAPTFGGVELGSGLGFVRNVIIDQHFAERGRMGRLITAVSQQPRYLGLGIDENTAIVVEDGHFRVVGEGAVMVVDASNMRFNNFATVKEGEPLALDSIHISLVPNGYGLDIETRRILTPEDLRKGKGTNGSNGKNGKDRK